MKRNAFLITVVLFCLVTAATAADQKKDAQPQSNENAQAQVVGNKGEAGKDHASSSKSDCAEKQSQDKKSKQQDNHEGDPDAPQNHVEYGGGG